MPAIELTDTTTGARATTATTPLARAATTTLTAPSPLPTRPWRWRLHDTTAELHADPSPQPAADPSRQPGADPHRRPATPHPDGHSRTVTVAGGVALHQARTALTALGHVPEITRRPDPASPDLLAVLRAGPPHPPRPDEVRAYRAVLAGPTHRQPTTATTTATATGTTARTGPVPAAALRRLREAAEANGAHLNLVTDDLPAPLVRYAVLSCDADTPAGWLAGGEALAAIVITATVRGMAISLADPALPDYLMDRSAGTGCPLLVLCVSGLAGPTGPASTNGTTGAVGPAVRRTAGSAVPTAARRPGGTPRPCRANLSC
jgi:hypothetical protein